MSKKDDIFFVVNIIIFGTGLSFLFIYFITDCNILCSNKYRVLENGLCLETSNCTYNCTYIRAVSEPFCSKLMYIIFIFSVVCTSIGFIGIKFL